MISNFLQVAIGGAIGSCLRYGVGLAALRLAGPGFPVGVLAVNVLGSFLMGVFAMLALDRSLAHLSPLVMTGLLGGFTTFSAFSLDAVTLWERGAMGQAALYVGLSVGLSIGALILGAALTRGGLA
ncbi:fluoride efflux transporter CrcB [Roseovarius autotrophicus]|uniref:fluoride efflux transporter CrcB n=1 Tax=Roseovarius autotrophicus TaxID=2824121 RepID=UPI0019E71606|nr:fluoride efflux transporter CrcB [Roseovarius autotrophicus]MBE0453717.1 fluoride efflux transporter CrcB [Roseovarius sp.]